MDWWQVIVLAIVEGATEFLPISSTGHMVLASKLINLPQTEFVKSFEIVIQLGAILAVAIMYGQRMWVKKEETIRVAVAFVPTMILGLVFYKFIKEVLLGNVWVTIAALGIGGAVVLAFDDDLGGGKEKIENLSWVNAAKIGLFQSISMIPGVSRALATIWGGMGVGLSRKEAVEMSFMLAIPTMAAATGLDLLKSGWAFSGGEWGRLILGFAGAFVTAWIVVRWLLSYVQKHSFKLFGIYRIILATTFLLLVL